MGELICNRAFEKTATGYAPGQHEARILDPRPHRDRADLAAILTYADDEGMACDILCLRYRDERWWRSIKLTRAGLRKKEQTTVAGCPELSGVLLDTVLDAAEGVVPFPFEEPSEDEQSMRRLAHALIDRVEEGSRS